jgi:hypothetical protein
MTAASGIDTIKTGVSNSNDVANAAVKGLLTTGTVDTTTSSSAVLGGGKVVSKARTEGVNILNGLIRANVVTTTGTVTRTGTVGVSTTAHTTFVGLHIAQNRLPLTIPNNYGVNIPGVAAIVLNAVQTARTSDGQIVTNTAGLYIRLLKSMGNSPAGTEIWLNPSHSQIANHTDGPGTVGGYAYGTRVIAKAGSAAGLNSGPSAMELMPPGGTSGQPQTNSTAKVDVPNVLNVGAVQDKATGSVRTDYEDSRTDSSVANINLLGGLIKADAVTATAQAVRSGSSTVPTFGHNLDLVNLSIGGKPMPVNVSPNTVITVGNIAKVTVYDVVTTPTAIGVVGLQVQLLSPYKGLQTGSIIQVAVANASDGS